MILVLLSYSKNLLYSQTISSKPINPSTGGLLKTDTANAVVPISFIRDANAKLIERLYLLKVNKQQDSIINLNKVYIFEQDKIIKDFQGRVLDLNIVNTALNNTITKQRNINKILTGVSITSIAIAIAIIFIK